MESVHRKTLFIVISVVLFFGAGQVAFAQTPRVRASDQAIEDGTVRVRLAVSNGPGWLVVHKDQNGGPGPVVGFAAVRDGRNRNVTIAVDTDEVTNRVFIMLHRDTGKLGTYEFPDGDPPAQDDDGVVVIPIAIE